MRTLLATMLVMTSLVLGRASWATAYYVYHEHTSSDATDGNTSTCGGAVPYVDVLAPTASEAVTVRFKVEHQFDTDRVRLYYTVDGSAPQGAFGVASGSSSVIEASYQCTVTYSAVTDIASAVIPAQAAGTRVRYVVSAWKDLQGDEVFGNSGTCDVCTACTTSSCATVFEYTVQDPVLDAGSAADVAPTVDSAAPADAAGGADQQPGVDTATAVDSASAPDTAPGPDVTAASDSATGVDVSPPDVTVAPDTAVAADQAVAPDQATAPDQASGPDTAVADTAVGQDSASPVDSALAADVATGVDAGPCTPGCQDPYYKVVCGPDGQSIVVPCSADTTCLGGRCVKPDAGTAQVEETGCGCRSNLASSTLPAGLLLGAIALWRRRRS